MPKNTLKLEMLRNIQFWRNKINTIGFHPNLHFRFRPNKTHPTINTSQERPNSSSPARLKVLVVEPLMFLRFFSEVGRLLTPTKKTKKQKLAKMDIRMAENRGIKVSQGKYM